jgi:hypothetical protein
MTNEQMNIAIAETCGWKNYGLGWGHSSLPPQANVYGRKLPDYCNDLNAMHEAEKVLWNRNDWSASKYEERLTKATTSWAWHATAAQRAEAFLKTIGKWEDA